MTMTRRQLALAHLAGATGCTLSELAAALGWRRASVRGLLSLLRKEGWNIQSDMQPDKTARLRLVPRGQSQSRKIQPSQETWMRHIGLMETG